MKLNTVDWNVDQINLKKMKEHNDKTLLLTKMFVKVHKCFKRVGFVHSYASCHDDLVEPRMQLR